LMPETGAPGEPLSKALRRYSFAAAFPRCLRIAISALSCSFMRANSGVGRFWYLASSSASALSSERRPLIAFSISSTIPMAIGLGEVRDGGWFARGDPFGQFAEAVGKREQSAPALRISRLERR